MDNGNARENYSQDKKKLNSEAKIARYASHKTVKFDQVPMKSGIWPVNATSAANLKFQEF